MTEPIEADQNITFWHTMDNNIHRDVQSWLARYVFHDVNLD